MGRLQDGAITSWLWHSVLGGLGCLGVSYGLRYVVPMDERMHAALELLQVWWGLGMFLNGVAMGLFLCAWPLLTEIYARPPAQRTGGERTTGKPRKE